MRQDIFNSKNIDRQRRRERRIKLALILNEGLIDDAEKDKLIARIIREEDAMDKEEERIEEIKEKRRQAKVQAENESYYEQIKGLTAEEIFACEDEARMEAEFEQMDENYIQELRSECDWVDE